MLNKNGKSKGDVLHRRIDVKKIVAIVLLVLTAVTFLGTSVYAAGVMLSTDGFEKQEKTNWCWVASALNSVHYETSSNRTQKAAVMYIKGTVLNWYPNEGGTIAEIEEAAEYISKGTENYTGTDSETPFVFLRNEVNYNNVTIICAGRYSGDVRTGGHAVAVTGYYTSGTEEYITYYDPMTGSNKTCSYSELCNNAVSGGRYDKTCFNNES